MDVVFPRQLPYREVLIIGRRQNLPNLAIFYEKTEQMRLGFEALYYGRMLTLGLK